MTYIITRDFSTNLLQILHFDTKYLKMQQSVFRTFFYRVCVVYVRPLRLVYCSICEASTSHRCELLVTLSIREMVQIRNTFLMTSKHSAEKLWTLYLGGAVWLGCMCVCDTLCMCQCVYVCIFVCTCVWWLWLYFYVCVLVCVSVRVNVWVSVCVCMCRGDCVCLCVSV